MPLTDGGRIGITFCPGKKQPAAASGSWNRDLDIDLDAIAAWGATATVTLIEDAEIEALGVKGLGNAVASRHMEWLHLPITDVSVPGPAFETAWQSAGERLRARLRDGFDVVVHCKGGLGRAGSVAARLMVELGVEPAKAVHVVRHARPGAIETQAQERHVLAAEHQPERLPSVDRAEVVDRAKGALLGLAVGDAVGTTLEFKARDSYPRLVDMVGGGPFGLKPGEWTDDTAMALALADSLTACAGFDAADLMDRFVKWHEQGVYSCTGSCFDIGITTRAALSKWKRTGDPYAGSTDPQSAGNGSLMRLSPVAVRYWNDEAARHDVAARQSRTTHAAPEAVDACVLFADILADAIAGKPRSFVLRNRSGPYAGSIEAIAGGGWRGKPRHEIKSSGYVAHALEAALWSVGRTLSFSPAGRCQPGHGIRG